MAAYASSPLFVRQFAPTRRQREARSRMLTLAVIAALAAGGVLAQALWTQVSPNEPSVAVAQAAAQSGPFDYFPG